MCHRHFFLCKFKRKISTDFLWIFVCIDLDMAAIFTYIKPVDIINIRKIRKNLFYGSFIRQDRKLNGFFSVCLFFLLQPQQPPLKLTRVKKRSTASFYNTALPFFHSSSIAFFTKYQRISNTNGPIVSTPFHIRFNTPTAIASSYDRHHQSPKSSSLGA